MKYTMDGYKGCHFQCTRKAIYVHIGFAHFPYGRVSLTQILCMQQERYDALHFSSMFPSSDLGLYIYI